MPAGICVSGDAPLRPAPVLASISPDQSAGELLLGVGCPAHRRAAPRRLLHVEPLHGVVSDPFARLPEFLERFHRLFARAQNAALGRWENLWSSDKASVVLLVWSKTSSIGWRTRLPTHGGGPGYRAQSMTGCHHTPYGRTVLFRVEMPGRFFDHDGALPPEAELAGPAL